MQSRLTLKHFIFRDLYLSPADFYRESFKPKEKFGKPQVNNDGSHRMRQILKPVYSLKSIQKEINDFLREYDLPECMYGGVPGKNNISNALQHSNKKYFLTIDLKNFFGNITNTRIHQTLIRRGLTWEEARVITRLTTLDGHLPQGAPTSTILANLIFAPTVLFLESFCKERNITFTVFVDDLTFSSSQNFKHCISPILNILRNDDFFVNHNKIHYKKDCCEITGLIVKNGKLFLPKDMLKHIDKPGIKTYADAVAKQYNAHKMKNKSRSTFIDRLRSP